MESKKIYRYLLAIALLLFMLLQVTDVSAAENVESYFVTGSSYIGYGENQYYHIKYVVEVPVGYFLVNMPHGDLAIVDNNGNVKKENIWTYLDNKTAYEFSDNMYHLDVKLDTSDITFPYAQQWGWNESAFSLTSLPVIKSDFFVYSSGHFYSVKNWVPYESEMIEIVFDSDFVNNSLGIYGSLNDIKNAKYPSPVITHVNNVGTTYNFFLALTDSLPSELIVYLTANTIDIEGIKTGHLVGSDATENYYPLSFLLRTDDGLEESPWTTNGYISVNYEYLLKYLNQRFGVNGETLESLEFELYYKYDDVKSKKTKYTYDCNTGAVSGSFWDSSTGDFVIDDSIVNEENKGNLIVEDTDDSTVDGFVNIITNATSGFKRILTSFLSLFSLALSFINQIGKYFEIILGSSLGFVVLSGLLVAVVLRVLGR